MIISYQLTGLKSIYKNFFSLKKRINSDVTIVVVGKNRTVEELKEAVAAGAKFIGENRAQELVEKYPALNVTWHFIGHLQTNKIDLVIPRVAMIQSLDSLKLALKLDVKLRNLGKKMPVLLEVNTSKEESKYGFLPGEIIEVTQKINGLKNLQIRGLMTMGKLVKNPEENRPYFKLLFNLAQQIKNLKLSRVSMQYLSAGTSRDFEIAIEEGANIIRLGEIIFKS